MGKIGSGLAALYASVRHPIAFRGTTATEESRSSRGKEKETIVDAIVSLKENLQPISGIRFRIRWTFRVMNILSFGIARLSKNSSQSESLNGSKSQIQPIISELCSSVALSIDDCRSGCSVVEAKSTRCLILSELFGLDQAKFRSHLAILAAIRPITSANGF